MILNSLNLALIPITKAVDQGYEDTVVEKREFWHWFWLGLKKDTVRVKRPEKQQKYYTVSLQEIINKANRLIKGNIKTIKLGVNQYLNEDFKQRVDIFFATLIVT